MGQSRETAVTSSGLGMALVLTVILSVLVGGTIHYSLKQYEDAQAGQAFQRVQEAGEREMVALSRMFASLGGGLVQSDLFRLQEMLSADLGREGLIDAVVVDHDNMVMASKVQSLIGKQMQDATWLSLRAQNKEVVSRTYDQAGGMQVVVMEPMKEKDEIVAWARMTYVIPQPAKMIRSRSERLMQTATLLCPIAAAIFAVVWAAFRISASGMRKQIQAVMAPMYGGGAAGRSEPRLKKAS